MDVSAFLTWDKQRGMVVCVDNPSFIVDVKYNDPDDVHRPTEVMAIHNLFLALPVLKWSEITYVGRSPMGAST